MGVAVAEPRREHGPGCVAAATAAAAVGAAGAGGAGAGRGHLVPLRPAALPAGPALPPRHLPRRLPLGRGQRRLPDGGRLAPGRQGRLRLGHLRPPPGHAARGRPAGARGRRRGQRQLQQPVPRRRGAAAPGGLALPLLAVLGPAAAQRDRAAQPRRAGALRAAAGPPAGAGRRARRYPLPLGPAAGPAGRLRRLGQPRPAPALPRLRRAVLPALRRAGALLADHGQPLRGGLARLRHGAAAARRAGRPAPGLPGGPPPAPGKWRPRGPAAARPCQGAGCAGRLSSPHRHTCPPLPHWRGEQIRVPDRARAAGLWQRRQNSWCEAGASRLSWWSDGELKNSLFLAALLRG